MFWNSRNGIWTLTHVFNDGMFNGHDWRQTLYIITKAMGMCVNWWQIQAQNLNFEIVNIFKFQLCYLNNLNVHLTCFRWAIAMVIGKRFPRWSSTSKVCWAMLRALFLTYKVQMHPWDMITLVLQTYTLFTLTTVMKTEILLHLQMNN